MFNLEVMTLKEGAAFCFRLPEGRNPHLVLTADLHKAKTDPWETIRSANWKDPLLRPSVK